MAFGIWVQWPDFRASATVVNAALKYECVTQPPFARTAVMTGGSAVDRPRAVGAARRHRHPVQFWAIINLTDHDKNHYN
jgi:hypothetical protein